MAVHLVTGGSGFLGNLIARRLHESGETVKILDIWEDASRPREIEFIHCDICNREGVECAMQGIDVVHHNVALVPLTKSGKRFDAVNVGGSINAAQAAAKAGVSHFIHMSSSAVYGVPESCPITEKTPFKPVEIYGAAKLKGEQAVAQICQNADLPYLIIRPRTILGEGRLGIFQILFEWISENRNVYVIGSGNIGFQFVHARDLMDAYMLLASGGHTGGYNIGTPDFGTLRQALENLIAYAGSASKVRSLPEKLSIATLQTLDKLHLSPLAPWHYLTYHKAFHFEVSSLLEIGWQPKYGNDSMLRESYDWFLKNAARLPDGAGGMQSPHRRAIGQKLLGLLKRLS